MIIAVDYDDTIIQNGSVYVSLVQYLDEVLVSGGRQRLTSLRKQRRGEK